MTAPFTTLTDFRGLLAAAPRADQVAVDGAAARNGQLTKPPGALGRLEDLALWLAGWQGTDRPRIAAPQIVIFAGNHGICAQGVSAFPAEVTAQMVGNFQGGGHPDAGFHPRPGDDRGRGCRSPSRWVGCS